MVGSRSDLGKWIAYGGLGAGLCIAAYGAAVSGRLIEVVVIAVGFCFPMSWGVGEILSRRIRRQRAMRYCVVWSALATIVLGSLIYGALDIGVQHARSPAASWLVSIGLIVLTVSAAAIPLASRVPRSDP